MEDFNLYSILIDQNSSENILVYISYKTLIDSKVLCIRVNSIKSMGLLEFMMEIDI